MDDGREREARVPADQLPIAVVGILAICFLVYFGAASALSARAPATAAVDDTYDVELCNDTTATGLRSVYVAIAYFDAARGEIVTRGWFPQKQGECKLVLRHLLPPLYVYAESEDGTTSWSGEQGEDALFCVGGREPFKLTRAECDGGLKSFRTLPRASGDDGKVLRWRVRDESKP